nr:hypothetical protein [Photobacterium phosphoreum]
MRKINKITIAIFSTVLSGYVCASDTSQISSVAPFVSAGLCDEFNVYPEWTRGDHAGTGDIMVNKNIAYSAVYW